MIKQIKTVKKARTLLIESINDLSAEQLNEIPTGFNNSISWNLGHMIVVQQGICYKRAGLPTLINDDFWEKFRSGSKPERFISEDEITHIKKLLLITLQQLETDYNKRIFNNYTSWITRSGMEVTTIDNGIKFLSFHEGLHADTIMAIKKLVIK